MHRGRIAAVFGGGPRSALAFGAPPNGGDGLRSGPRRKPFPREDKPGGREQRQNKLLD